jgi:dUTP pyrophosphatase
MMQEEITKIGVLVLDKECAPKMMQTGDAAYDLRAGENFWVKPGVPAKVPLGVAFKMPPGFCGIITHRSSLAFKHSCTCSYGLIDSSYDREVYALIFNHGTCAKFFEKGERICQIRFTKHELVELEETTYEYIGKHGLGSSGRK